MGWMVVAFVAGAVMGWWMCAALTAGKLADEEADREWAERVLGEK